MLVHALLLPVRLKLRRIKRHGKKEIQKLAGMIVTPGTTVVTEGCAVSMGPAYAGCQHLAHKIGSGRQAARHPAFQWVNAVLGNIKSAITGTYRAVREKHVPRALAEFEYRFNRRYDLTTIIPCLGWVATRTLPMPYRLLKLAEDGA